MYQTYLDAEEMIDESDLVEADKDREKFKHLEARKSAFGPQFRYYPPWKSR